MTHTATQRPLAAEDVVHLRAGGTSVVVLLSDERLPRILHWGEDLGELRAQDLVSLAATAMPGIGDSAVTYPQPVPVLAQLPEGWMGRPGLIADRDGAQWAAKFTVSSFTCVDGDEAQALTVSAVDEQYGLDLVVEIEVLHASGLVRQRATLRNARAGRLRVGALELALPVPAEADEVMDLTGRWALERVPQRRAFDVGEWVRTSRGGKPGLEHTMLVLAGRRGFGFRSGRVWATHLAWSGNQTLGAERTPADVRRLVASEVLVADEVTLDADEQYVSPWQYGSWGDGLDELAARFHRHLRASPAHPGTPRPVILNTWEAVYFDHDPTTLIALAERGAEAGAERFVVDDGWFVGRRDDTTSLGDWTIDRERWPDGLAPLANRVRELGMDFGLWFEPEMINLDSDLARAHPEWLFDAGHGAGMPSRHQHVLDLGHPDAEQYVLEAVSALVAELDIAYIKWDHNRYLLDAGHTPTGTAGYRAHTLAAYRVMDELHRRHPGLEIESCASGGGRIDLGVLARTQRVWPSDCNDPHERMEIQRWTGLLVPPEYQGTHIGAEHSHTTHRQHPLSYRGEKAIWGNLGVELNLLVEDEGSRAAVASWIALHKRFRSLLHGGVSVHADLAEPAARLEGVVAADGSEALFALSLTERPRTWPLGRLTIPGLDDDRTYRVTRVTPEAEPLGDAQPMWLADGVELPGRVLRVVGVEMPNLDPDRSVLLRFEG
ncbi:alpha-galactosidase [Microbacterium saperdae]|uniref:Alpha-galactosidase n=1 Tax=Microbacterium saperdae TaxID=69368 RepID=A0A543BBL6_9MICO|nr:alpha-galactosidase [Microbacterium saperdae]TQL82156.1 alpha-galactosidase [Microbacterium saperdae]GGM37582.1 alpha-galactosidase [Microbacterium saperdae]